MSKVHSFHIPVLGIGFTIDTPIKVSQYGIDSVISLGDDILLEKLRKMYCNRFKLTYEEITNKFEDYRAKRITAYLNLINDLAKKKFEELKEIALGINADLKEYLRLLPENSSIKEEFKQRTLKSFNVNNISEWVKDTLSMGSIDVNIMTKLDKENYNGGEKLPIEYNDAHAALRGYANSNLTSSVILSAGLNPKLYSYIEEFTDFYPNEKGEMKKKIILKVSDYRSAFIQGKFLANKGLWVSEYRIESGLNCGGHAFATDGFLMGPILSEFKDKRDELRQKMHDIYTDALSRKNRSQPKNILHISFSAQGGVGTSEEHQFLLDYYQMDSVGWGTPFLLVPEITSVDDATLKKLADAKEDDLYLSQISPLGVPFNNLKNSSKELEKLVLNAKGKHGSPCVRKFLALNKEFSEQGLCTASSKYQNLKIQELKKRGLTINEYNKQFATVINKECLCTGLETSVLKINNLGTKLEGDAVSICPGPNMAYFSKVMSLKEITDHIYGRINVITRTDRPNMFVKELNIYIDYLASKVEDSQSFTTKNQKEHLTTFAKNLNSGLQYYINLFNRNSNVFSSTKSTILKDLKNSEQTLQLLTSTIYKLKCTL